MLAVLAIIPHLLTNESVDGRRWGFLTAVYLYLCIHISIYHRLDACSLLCFASVQTQTHHVNAPCVEQIGAFCTRKSCPGLVILKLKACLFTRSQFQARGREYEGLTQRREEHWACAVIFTARESHSLLSIPLNQETSCRKGRRIRIVREQRVRKRVDSLILMGFSEVHPSVWKYTECAFWIKEGWVQDSMPH